MKAEELRIGNWVYFNGVVEKIDLDSFHGIAIYDYLDLDPFHGIATYDCLDSYNPIPLTEEWILKFGFCKVNKVDYESNCGTLELEDTDGGFLFDSRIVIKYVHQLQNLYFALTEEELKIK
jgi:hypothetical protein